MAFNDDIRAKPFKSGFDNVDSSTEESEVAVPCSESGYFVPLGVDEVELLDQRVNVVLQDYFVVAPCGPSE